MKQKNLNPGVLPVSALHMGRGEGVCVGGTISWQSSADEVTGNYVGVTPWLWYCHRASFTSEQELLVRSGWLFAFWHLYLDLSPQFPNWTLDVLQGPCEEWSAPHTCWQLASQAETSQTFLPNAASTCADPLLYLLPPAFVRSFSPNFHATVILFFSAANLPLPSLLPFSLFPPSPFPPGSWVSVKLCQNTQSQKTGFSDCATSPCSRQSFLSVLALCALPFPITAASPVQ